MENVLVAVSFPDTILKRDPLGENITRSPHDLVATRDEIIGPEWGVCRGQHITCPDRIRGERRVFSFSK